MARSRRELRSQPDIWPGFVDALSTLLLVIIFLLVVFVLSQFFLNQLLEGRDEQVDRLEDTVADLSANLEDEQSAFLELQRNLTALSADLQGAVADRDDLSAELAQTEADRDDFDDRLRLSLSEKALLSRSLDDLRVRSEDEQRLALSLRQELDEARKTISADRDAIEVQLAQLISLRQDIDALQSVRDQLETRVAEYTGLLDAARSVTDALELEGDELRRVREELTRQFTEARDRAMALEEELSTEEERTALSQREIDTQDIRIDDLEAELTQTTIASADAMAQVRILTQQINALRVQLASLDQALQLKQVEIDDQNVAIENLGERLNLALASKVEELSRFRSDFFGRLRDVLGSRSDVSIVGDRFVFQSEVLFPSGSAQMQPGGREQLRKLATTLKQIAAEIPQDLPWILRIDGHTDRRPIRTAEFPSNWELSTARAISVARFLATQGIPPERLAATGFAEFQPLDNRFDEIAYRRNRRIEIKLTTR